MKVIGVMPLKLNNERLPGKNTRLLGGKPLFWHQLEAVVSTGMCDDVYVFCSDCSLCALLPAGIKYLQRDPNLDLPTSNFTQIFSAFSLLIDADIYVYIHATAPFVTKKTIEDCLRAVLDEGFDSAFCATCIQDFLWQDGKPLNFDPTNLPRSQDIPPIYRETSGVYVFKKSVFEKLHRRIGDNPFIKTVTYKEAVDINTLQDFALAEALLEAKI